jgi:hypothetical protein
MRRAQIWIAFAALLAGCRDDTPPPSAAKGTEARPATKVLEVGADMAQPEGPVRALGMYMVGFHPLVDDPTHPMEAHHYCHQVNEDLAQCVLYDGNTRDSDLVGVEYIVSEKLFATLPATERRLWHPHNYEILSGQLVLPGLPDAVEKTALARKINSYGKTWQLWRSDRDRLPLGEPHLGWSYNADGELPPAVLAERDERMDIDSGARRKARTDLSGKAHAQEGTDRLAKWFPHRDASSEPR